MQMVYDVYDDDGCKGIYSTLKLAEEAKKRFGGCCSIGESYLDEMPPLVDGKYHYCVTIKSDKSYISSSIIEMSMDGIIAKYEGEQDSYWLYNREPKGNLFIHKCFAINEEEAYELAKAALFPCPPMTEPWPECFGEGVFLTAIDVIKDHSQEMFYRAYEIGKDYANKTLKEDCKHITSFNGPVSGIEDND